MEAAVAAAGLTGTALFRVPADYYDRPLSARADILNCPVDRLCKTLVFLNESAGTTTDVASLTPETAGRSRYIAVVLQYITKLDVPTLEKYLRSSAGAPADTRLVLAPDGARVTGFAHNAVSVLGSATPMPVVLAKPVAQLRDPAYVWLGGGEPDVKLRLFIKQLLPGKGAPAAAGTAAAGATTGGGASASAGLPLVLVSNCAFPKAASDDADD